MDPEPEEEVVYFPRVFMKINSAICELFHGHRKLAQLRRGMNKYD